jgi:hypothetical protein
VVGASVVGAAAVVVGAAGAVLTAGVLEGAALEGAVVEGAVVDSTVDPLPPQAARAQIRAAMTTVVGRGSVRTSVLLGRRRPSTLPHPGARLR